MWSQSSYAAPTFCMGVVDIDPASGLQTSVVPLTGLGNLRSDESVSSGRLRLPGATTPAEEENREPAKAADGRRFAPWHDAALRGHDAGRPAGRHPVHVKECLHMIHLGKPM